MNKRKLLTIALTTIGVSGLLLLLIQIMTVASVGSHASAPSESPVLRGVAETEPNDTIDTADPIDLNVTMVGAIPIAQPGDIDWYRLVLSGGDIGRDFRATLEETLPDADYRLELNLFDSDGSLVDSVSSPSTSSLAWTSTAITYYLRVRAVEFDTIGAPGDADYELTVLRLARPWDDCEVNDIIDGAWSPNTPPGGPCLLALGETTQDLNFIPYTGQPVPNADYFTFLAKGGHTYRITTYVSGGADTEMWLYDPSNTQIAYDDDGGPGAGSRIERTLNAGWHKVLVRDRLGNTTPPTSHTYDILVADVTPDILHAKPNASGDASCSDWENACTLQAALGVANPGDEIWVEEGVYKPTHGIGHASCQEIRDALPDAPNGDYLIDNGGYVFQVYCDNMDSTPVEYLSLRSGIANYAQYTAGGPSPGTNVETDYSRVRLLPDSLQIDISDQRYSSSTGSLTHGTTEVTSMPYGVAMDCLALGSNRGFARIDLRGTPFAVSDTFMKCGFNPGGSWTFSQGNQVVQLRGGGYCGWVQPAAPGCLATPFNDAGGAQPILELDYQGPERRATFQLRSGVAMYGGFAGTETSREERDSENNPTVLSGDIDNNDITDPHGVITTTAHISGSNSYHVVTGSGVDVTAVLDGFTITGGDADGPGAHSDGGGTYNKAGNPTLRNITFSGNFAAWSGGGMYNFDSSPELTNVTFSGNSSLNPGGGMCNRHSSPELTNVTFSGNSGLYGGGMFNFDSSPELTDVTFSGNSAAGNSGGGMFNSQSSPELINVTFSGNSTRYGGGMCNRYSSSPELTNVTFSGNYALYRGGGMFNEESSPKLTNVTFSGNSAGKYGGGMYNGVDISVKLTNAILWGNTDGGTDEQDAQIFNVDSTITVSYSLVAGGVYTGSGNISADPLFVRDPDPGDGDWTTPGDNDYGDLRLQLTSPAIDAGDNTAVPSDTLDLDGDGDTAEPLPFDLDGNARFVDIPSRPDTGVGPAPIVDMGAYEAQVEFYMPLVLRNH